ncbi:hypothetical protein FB451DRAFT_1184921 [Mycena latifolia]|nr:hypothetical protein FB451DRAFT_1184921 [Mycena latifolia]
MSGTSNLSAASLSPQPEGSTLQTLTSRSRTDWLATALTTAKAVTAGAECLPFPYVKGVFGTVVLILETVEQVKKNRDDLKELCTNIMEIIRIVQDQLSSHGDTAAIKFKALCEDLEGVLQGVLSVVKQLHTEPRGFSGRFREVIKLSSTADAIARSRTRIQELRSNFLMLQLMAAIDTNLQVSKAVLRRISHDSIQLPHNLSKCPPPSRIFHGRKMILDQLHVFFAQDLGKQHIFVLHGLGGTGKTQIALKFIEDSLNQFSDVFLIDSSTVETIDTGLRNIAVTRRAGITAQDALYWLSSKPNTWLLLFDNADDPKINLNEFFPQCNHGNILITSRNPGLQVYSGSHSVVLDMEKTDAVELLLKSAAKNTTPSNTEIASEIVKYTTWQLSFQQLSKPAALFLQLCSFLHHEGISEQIFARASLYSCSAHGPSKEELQGSLDLLSHFVGPTGAWDSLRFLDVINEIRAYSLVNFDPGEKLFSIHPLVQSWSRSIAEEPYHHWMVAILGMSIAGIPWDHRQLAAQTLCSHIDSLISGDTKISHDFREEYGRMYWWGDRLKEAQELQVSLVAQRRSVLGEDHIATVRAMGHLGNTYNKLGRFTEAVDLQVMVVDKQRDLLGENHPDTLRSMIDLGTTYGDLGQLKTAVELEIVALQKCRTFLGEHHLHTIGVMSNLGSTYHTLGQFKEAEELEIVVLEKRKTLLGEEHPQTLRAMGNLAATYNKLGCFKQAAELEALVLTKRRRILGESHLETLQAMSNLAATYKELGREKDAEAMELLVVEKRRNLLGGEHPDTLLAMGNLAVTYHQMGRLKNAEELEIVVLEKRRKVLNDDHPYNLYAMRNLAWTYTDLGKFKEAAELEVLILEKEKNRLGENHPDTLWAMANLASTYEELGMWKEAEALESVVLAKRLNHFGRDHPDTLLAIGALASTLRHLGRLNEAHQLYSDLLSLQTNLVGKKHPDTLATAKNLKETQGAIKPSRGQRLKIVVQKLRHGSA